MSKVIYKYKLNTVKETLKLPYGSRILSVVNQNETITIYSLIDLKEKRTSNYNFEIIPTGVIIDDSIVNAYTFLGTVSLLNGREIYHVFYKTE